MNNMNNNNKDAETAYRPYGYAIGKNVASLYLSEITSRRIYYSNESQPCFADIGLGGGAKSGCDPHHMLPRSKHPFHNMLFNGRFIMA